MLCQWVRIWACLPMLRQWVSVADFQCFVFREVIYVSSVSPDGTDAHIDRCAKKVNHIDLIRSSVYHFFLPLNLITVSIFPSSIPWLANVFWAFRKVLGSGWEWFDTILASEDLVVLEVCHLFLFQCDSIFTAIFSVITPNSNLLTTSPFPIDWENTNFRWNFFSLNVLVRNFLLASSVNSLRTQSGPPYPGVPGSDNNEQSWRIIFNLCAYFLNCWFKWQKKKGATFEQLVLK